MSYEAALQLDASRGITNPSRPDLKPGDKIRSACGKACMCASPPSTRVGRRELVLTMRQSQGIVLTVAEVEHTGSFTSARCDMLDPWTNQRGSFWVNPWGDFKEQAWAQHQRLTGVSFWKVIEEKQVARKRTAHQTKQKKEEDRRASAVESAAKNVQIVVLRPRQVVLTPRPKPSAAASSTTAIPAYLSSACTTPGESQSAPSASLAVQVASAVSAAAVAADAAVSMDAPMGTDDLAGQALSAPSLRDRVM